MDSLQGLRYEQFAHALCADLACGEDGVVEGLEMPGKRFVVGVQWHPETFWDHEDSFQPLFDAHAEATRWLQAERPAIFQELVQKLW